MKLYLEIKADTNDSDYVTKRSEISESDLDRFKPLIEAISKNRGGYNWQTSDYGDTPPEQMYHSFPPELIEEFNDEYVPYGERGVYSIDQVKLLKIAEEVYLMQ
jgi:hypothetical protein